ncbi:MAG: hypothetical protein QF412_02870, partial [Planctomycetota bacterium]|nr:hypothetical protein [Planctomycetota bacterium]
MGEYRPIPPSSRVHAGPYEKYPVIEYRRTWQGGGDWRRNDYNPRIVYRIWMVPLLLSTLAVGQKDPHYHWRFDRAHLEAGVFRPLAGELPLKSSTLLGGESRFVGKDDGESLIRW